jgi:cell division protein FtsW
MIAHDPERRGRILAFLNPEKYADDEAFQLMQALYAFVVGGARGVGLGQSMQKRNYLPEAHTDFILAIIGEELGFWATLLVVLLNVAVLGCGFFISMKTPDRFARLLSFGITLTLSAQAMLNIGVVTGALPTKGIPLPFISFGGSSLVMSLAMVGILVNIARQTTDDFGDEERRIIKDRAHHL